mgnify:CR=1 FL=1
MILPTWQRSIQKLFLPKRWPVHNQGWTLIELAVVAVIAGILASLAVPSMMGMMRNNQVSGAISQVKGTLQEAQQNAVRKGTSCSITVIESTGPTAGQNRVTTVGTIRNTVSGSGCLSSTLSLPDTVIMRRSSTLATIVFSYKGNTTDSGTITLESTDGTADTASTIGSRQKWCLSVSNGLGIMRTGNYTGNTEASVALNGTLNCKTSL